MKRTDLSWMHVGSLAYELAHRIRDLHQIKAPRIYGVPRGGIYAAMAVVEQLAGEATLAETCSTANVIIDDIIDSGSTKDRYEVKYPTVPFEALVRKVPADKHWYTFPWERMQNEQGPEENVRRILEYIGEDPKREGLIETPSRVVRSWAELYAGYKVDPAAILKTFTDGACDQMVVLKNIEFFSQCEHHLQPFVGKAHIGYMPNGKVVGISKLARLLEVYSRRLQIQERLGQQVVDSLMEVLKPKGAGCIIEARHLCMCARGVNKQNSIMVTSALKGEFVESSEARNEFYKMAGL